MYNSDIAQSTVESIGLLPFILLLVIPIAISAVCWFILGPTIKKVLRVLCNDDRNEVKDISGEFWQRIYLAITLFMPILLVLFFSQPTSLLSILRWSLFGALFLFLTIAHLVRQQIAHAQSVHNSLPSLKEETVTNNTI